MKHKNDVSLTWCGLIVFELREFTVRALYIVFLFVSDPSVIRDRRVRKGAKGMKMLEFMLTGYEANVDNGSEAS